MQVIRLRTRISPAIAAEIRHRLHHSATGNSLHTDHGCAPPPASTGSKSAEGCAASCRIVFLAEIKSRLVACSAPVFRLRSKRGKLLLEASRRSTWPFLKTLLVAHRSTESL